MPGNRPLQCTSIGDLFLKGCLEDVMVGKGNLGKDRAGQSYRTGQGRTTEGRYVDEGHGRTNYNRDRKG